MTSFEAIEGFSNNGVPNAVEGWASTNYVANRFFITDTQAFNGDMSLSVTNGFASYFATTPDYFAHEATGGSLYVKVLDAEWVEARGADYIARWEVYLGETQGSYSRLAMILRWGDTAESDFIIEAQNASGSYLVPDTSNYATRTLVGSATELDITAWNEVVFSLDANSKTLNISFGGIGIDSAFILSEAFTEQTFIGQMRVQASLNASSNGTAYFDYIHLYSVPEPSTWMLLGCGVGVFAMVARKRRKN